MTEAEQKQINALQERISILESDRRARGYRLLLLWASVIVVLAVGVTWVNVQNNRSIARERSAREASERALCQVIVVLDDTYRKAKPTTPAGIQVARAIANMRAVNHCAPRTQEVGK